MEFLIPIAAVACFVLVAAFVKHLCRNWLKGQHMKLEN